MLEMILKIDGTVGNFPTLKEFRESGEGLTVGGFCFRVQVNGKMLDVNFDFPAYAANVLSDNTLMFEAGAATFFSNHNDHKCSEPDFKYGTGNAAQLVSVKPEELKKMIHDGKVTDGFTMTALMMYLAKKTN